MVNYALASLAFSAGIISFLNPCGYAMLPAYISCYFAREENSNGIKRIMESLRLGLIVSTGFLSVFVSVGILFSYVSSQLKAYIPVVGTMVGIILVILGFSMFFSLWDKLNFTWFSNLGDRLKNTKSKNWIGYYLYGVGYALASLGCTLPIFIMIVTSALTLGSFYESILVFILYAVGMSLFMLIFSILVATSKTLILNYLRIITKYIKKISAVIIIFAGAYIIYYNSVYF